MVILKYAEIVERKCYKMGSFSELVEKERGLEQDQGIKTEFDQYIESDQGEIGIEEKTPFQFPEWLKAQTGAGSVDDYLEHTLNFNNSRSLARIIRGLSGIFENGLNYAVVDIVMGVFEFSKERSGKGSAITPTN